MSAWFLLLPGGLGIHQCRRETRLGKRGYAGKMSSSLWWLLMIGSVAALIVVAHILDRNR
jgi:hypothetical protein